MKNETIKNEEANQQEALLKNSRQSSQQELPPQHHARRIPAVEQLTLDFTGYIEYLYGFGSGNQTHYPTYSKT